MTSRDYFDFVDDNEILVKDRRVAIEHILTPYLAGRSAEQIAEELPLTPEEVHATITYYRHNREEIDSYLQRVEAITEAEYREWAKKPSPLTQRLRELRDERARKQRSSA